MGQLQSVKCANYGFLQRKGSMARATVGDWQTNPPYSLTALLIRLEAQAISALLIGPSLVAGFNQ
jgi:hypothetical protein